MTSKLASFGHDDRVRVPRHRLQQRHLAEELAAPERGQHHVTAGRTLADLHFAALDDEHLGARVALAHDVLTLAGLPHVSDTFRHRTPSLAGRATGRASVAPGADAGRSRPRGTIIRAPTRERADVERIAPRRGLRQDEGVVAGVRDPAARRVPDLLGSVQPSAAADQDREQGRAGGRGRRQHTFRAWFSDGASRTIRSLDTGRAIPVQPAIEDAAAWCYPRRSRTLVCSTSSLTTASARNCDPSAVLTSRWRRRKARSSSRLRRNQPVTSSLHLLALHEPHAGTTLSSVYRHPREIASTQSRGNGRSAALQYPHVPTPLVARATARH